VKLKDIGILNHSDLNQEFYNILEPKHKEAVTMIISCCGSEYYYKKLINETLWKYDLVILEDLLVFFGLQDMFQFCFLIDRSIEIKTLQKINEFLK